MRNTDTEKGGRIADVRNRGPSPRDVALGDGVVGDCDAGPTGLVQKPDSPRPDAPDLVDLAQVFVAPWSGAQRFTPPEGPHSPRRLRNAMNIVADVLRRAHTVNELLTGMAKRVIGNENDERADSPYNRFHKLDLDDEETTADVQKTTTAKEAA